MRKNCKNCTQVFEVKDEDLDFYDKMSPHFAGEKQAIPAPTLCPDCRAARRLGFRNERGLYHRKCDLTGKQIISVYDKDFKGLVYDKEVWWQDDWDDLASGRDFDFSRNFFPQFKELMADSPKMALMIKHAENADYAPYSIRYKDSYMCVSGFESEQIFYGYHVNKSYNCVDCTVLTESENCYECSYSNKLYECIDCFNCDNLQDSMFCRDCRNSENLIGCVGLRNKKYHILNKPYSKEDYLKIKDQIKRTFKDSAKNSKDQLASLSKTLPVLFATLTNSEDSTGDFVLNCKNAKNCFDVNSLEDAKYCIISIFSKDVYDGNYVPDSELIYESISANNSTNQAFTYLCWESHNLYYSHECMNCKDCFGCSSLKNKQYCIFNKQFTKETYEKEVAKIITHMQKTQEWGEYFPLEISPFGYNETVAQEYFPLEDPQKPELIATVHIQNQKYNWKTDEKTQDYLGEVAQIPADIQAVNVDFCKKILKCETTGKLYKIIPQELNFYKKMGLPIPSKCPDQRHKDRMNLRGKRVLHNENCQNCQGAIKTTFNAQKNKIFCEKCYLKEMY